MINIRQITRKSVKVRRKPPYLKSTMRNRQKKVDIVIGNRVFAVDCMSTRTDHQKTIETC